MNTKKMLFVFAAAAAAGVLVLMLRGLFIGSKKPEVHVAPPPVEVTEILVAASRIDPGKFVNADQLRWQAWPSKIVDATFIRKSNGQSIAAIVDGAVARAPIVEGEPVTMAKIIKAQGAGVMAATIAPGMRALAVPVKIENIAGGFVQPNNRVDVLDVRMASATTATSGIRRIVPQMTALLGPSVLAANVRVLAVDQTADGKDQKIVSMVRTVTLELTPEQVQAVVSARSEGDISLALHSLGDDGQEADSDAAAKKKTPVFSDVAVIRYGKSARRLVGEGGAQ